MTGQAVLADRWMVPKKWPPFFSMAGVTEIIYGKLPQHLTPFAAVRIVTGATTNLHVAKLGSKEVR
jgi:hypothetical protein